MKILAYAARKVWFQAAARRFWKEERGIGTLEIVLIAAVLIMVAIVFKDWIIEFVSSLTGKAEAKSDEIFS